MSWQLCSKFNVPVKNRYCDGKNNSELHLKINFLVKILLKIDHILKKWREIFTTFYKLI